MQFRRALTLFYLLGALAIAAPKEINPQIIVDPVGAITLNMSRTDTNIIEMPHPIISKYYSNEKDMLIEVVGNRAIIKFMPSVRQEFDVVNNVRTPVGDANVSYERIQTAELILITADNAVYTFRLRPVNMPIATVIIRSTSADIKEAIAYESASPYQETLGRITKDIFLGITPSGYRVEEVKNKFVIGIDKSSLTITNTRIFKGANFNAYLFKAVNTSKKERRFNPQLLFALAEKIAPKNPAKAASFYYGNYAHVAIPNQAFYGLIITQGGNNVRR
jgi:hypothetical protein